MRLTTDMICAIALAIGRIGCIIMGMTDTAGVIVGAIGGYMGKAALAIHEEGGSK